MSLNQTIASGQTDAATHQLPTFVQTNLVSDGFVPAARIDPNLINPWGISDFRGGPFFISDNGSGMASSFSGQGRPIPAAGANAITIAAPPGQDTPAAPTGQVFNNTLRGFTISDGTHSAPSLFLFATEDGTISGWNPAVNLGRSVIAVDHSQGGAGAVYKGLAIGTNGQGTFLYAANFRSGQVEMYDQHFHQVGSFTDPNLPVGYAPFNVQVLQGRLFVTFALQDAAKHDDVAGAQHGFVDEFNLNGQMLARVASGGPLNSPWGLDIAPSGFGPFGGDLLVGNFGDGTIHAFDLRTDMLAGVLQGADGKPLVIGDLWALTNGTGGVFGGNPRDVFFSAGVQDEAHGLFGSLSPGQTSGTSTVSASSGLAAMIHGLGHM